MMIHLQESNFSLCPICNRLIPKALLLAHANKCLDAGPTRDTGTATQSDIRAVKSPHKASPASTTASLTPSSISQAEPSLPSQGPQSHTILAVGREAPHDASQPPANDAFQKLMQNSREQSRVHNFYLEQKPAGTWHWHWWITQGGHQQVRAPGQVSAAAPALSQVCNTVEQISAAHVPQAYSAEHAGSKPQAMMAQQPAAQHALIDRAGLPSGSQSDRQDTAPAAQQADPSNMQASMLAAVHILLLFQMLG